MQGGVLVVANAGYFRGVFQAIQWVDSGIHMGDYFGLEGGTGLKLGRMRGSIWSYQCVKEHVCASVWVSEYKL